MSARTASLLLAPLLLAACGDDEVELSDDGREASGEVLEGSITDEMLPLEEVRSQAPLVEASAAQGSEEGADEGGAGASPAPGEAEAANGAESSDEAPADAEPAGED